MRWFGARLGSAMTPAGAMASPRSVDDMNSRRDDAPVVVVHEALLGASSDIVRTV
jgi:hypothetical protein